ncbi:MAG TPA: PAS domain-containing protein [Ktedonobacteraceae bacterium]
MFTRQYNKDTDSTDKEQRLYTHDRFRSFVEASANVFWVTTPEGAILEDSPSWANFTKQESTNYKGKGWLQAIYPQDRRHFEKMHRKTIETGMVTSFECRIFQADGQYHKVRIKSIPVRDLYGNIYEWMGTGTDISFAEQGRQIKGDQLQFAVQAAKIGIWDWYVPDDKIIWDDQCKTHIGRPNANDILDYQSFLSMLHPDDRERVNMLVQRTVNKEDENYNTEYRVIWPDQSVRWLAAQGKGLYDRRGKIIRMIGAMLDVTERKNVEAALRESETKFRRLVDANVIGILITNLERGNVLEANAAFLSLAGYSQEDIAAGRLSWRDLTTPEVADRNEMAIHETLSTGVLIPFETELLTKDGRRIPTLVAGALLEQSNDTTICFILDMTAQKDADKQKDAFISLASHELRTPLTSIKGNVQLAQRRLKRIVQNVGSLSIEEKTVIDEVELLLERTVHQTEIQNRLINDLLDVSRIDANKLELSPSLHDLISIVQETVENLHSTIPNRRLLFEHSEHDQVPVMVDSDRIGQVVANYITNALKYSAASEPVIVGLTVEGTEAKVWVRDFGPGLTVEEQEKVWQRFYQVPSSQIHNGHKIGLGLGLYICQTLIKQHHGKVGVESQPGQGCTFWFTLPIVQ